MYKYDIKRDEWEDTNRPMRETRNRHSCLLLNKEVFFVGGDDSTNRFQSYVKTYDN